MKKIDEEKPRDWTYLRFGDRLRKIVPGKDGYMHFEDEGGLGFEPADAPWYWGRPPGGQREAGRVVSPRTTGGSFDVPASRPFGGERQVTGSEAIHSASNTAGPHVRHAPPSQGESHGVCRVAPLPRPFGAIRYACSVPTPFHTLPGDEAL